MSEARKLIDARAPVQMRPPPRSGASSVARSDEELDLINELVNTVIYTDVKKTVIPLLSATLASINMAESQ